MHRENCMGRAVGRGHDREDCEGFCKSYEERKIIVCDVWRRLGFVRIG